MRLHGCKNRQMELITYEQLADFALNGADSDGLADFLGYEVIFEAKEAGEALTKFAEYLDMKNKISTPKKGA